MEVKLPCDRDYSLRSTCSIVALGRHDPTADFRSDSGYRLALRAPGDRPVTIVARQVEGMVLATLDGPGSEVMREHLAEALGLDHAPPRATGPRRLRLAALRSPGLRLPIAPTLFTKLVHIVLQQLVTFSDACLGWSNLVRRYGEPAPGRHDILLPPSPQALRNLTSAEFVACGILPEQGRRIRHLAVRAERLESIWNSGRGAGVLDTTTEFLLAQPGVGPWTVGYLRGVAMRDADAVVVGDLKFPSLIAQFLNGQSEGADDRQMLELLEPFRPHRFWVLMWILKSGMRPPRRGPKPPPGLGRRR